MANHVFSSIMAVAVFMFLTLSQTPGTSGQNRDPRICISYYDLEAVVNENTFLYARDNSYPIEDIFRDGFPENFRILKCTSEKEARRQNYPNFFYRINLTDLCIPDYIKPSSGHELLGSFTDSQLRICFAQMFSMKYAFLMDRRAGIFKQTFPFHIPGFNRIMQLHLINSTLYYRECTEDHYFFCVRRQFSNVSLSETDTRMIKDMQYNQKPMEEKQEKINTKTLNDYCQECEMKCKKEPEEMEKVAKDTEMQNNDRLISELMNNKEVEEKQVAKDSEMQKHPGPIDFLMSAREEHY